MSLSEGKRIVKRTAGVKGQQGAACKKLADNEIDAVTKLVTVISVPNFAGGVRRLKKR
jgi:hypothetical protein